MAQRWRCTKCHREWVFAADWNESHGCIDPHCREPHPELVTYTPQFRGGDIARHTLPTEDTAALFATSPDAKDGPGAIVQMHPGALALVEQQAASLTERIDFLRDVIDARQARRGYAPELDA